MQKQDGSYRMLLGNPHLVRALFECVLDAQSRAVMDWTQLEALPSDYISNDLRQRQGDVVWRVRRSDGGELYALILVEHQSTVSRPMAVRVASYCALLYESLVSRGILSADQRLPVVLPVVVYSGVRPWDASLAVAGLVDPPPDALAPYQLNMRYLLVDTGLLVRSGALPRDNFASLLFHLEHNRGIEEVQDLLQTVWTHTDAPQYAALRRAYTAWVKYVLLPRALPDMAIHNVETLMDIKDNLEDQSRSWVYQWKMEGMQEGLQKGRQEGRAEGAAALLGRQISRRFGPLAKDVRQKLDGATAAQLETWSLNILDAGSLDEVFRD